MQTSCADRSSEVFSPEEEDIKVKQTVLFSRSKEDYYGSLSEECRDSLISNMDSLKVNTEFWLKGIFDVFHGY